MSDSRRDAAPVLTCFDGFAALAFSTLCHLTIGDHRRALDLTVAAFAHHLPNQGDGRGCDRTAVITAAHRAFRSAATIPPAGRTGSTVSPLAELSMVELAVVDLRVSARMTVQEVAEVLDGELGGATVQAIESAAFSAMQTATFGQPLDTLLTATEVWFDDTMRERSRADLGRELGASPIVVEQRSPASPDRRSRRVAAAAVLGFLLVAVAIRVAVSWDSGDDATSGPAASEGAAAATTTLVERRSEKDPSELPDPATAGPTSLPAADPSTGGTSDGTTGDTTDDSSGGATDDAQASSPYPATDAFNFILGQVPEGFVPAGAAETSGHGTTWLEVWARPGSTRNAGRWFAITIVDQRFGAAPVLEGGTRTSDGEGTTTIAVVAADGVTYTVQRRTDGEIVRFETYGFDADRLHQLMAATEVTGRGDIEHSLSFADAVDQLEPLWSGWSDEQGFATRVGVATRQAFYRSTDGPGEIEVRTADQVVNDMTVARLLTAAPAAGGTDGQRMIVLSDRGALVGSAEDAPDVSGGFGPPTPTAEKLYAEFHTAGRTVTLVGRLPIDELIELGRSIRPASVEEWVLLRRAEPPQSTNGVQFQFQLTSIGSIVTTSGDTWSIGLIDTGSGAIALQQLQLARPASTDATPTGVDTFVPVHPEPDHPLLEFASFDATIVATVFDSPTTAAALRVTVDGEDPVDIPMTSVDEPALTGAAYVFSEFVGYTAVLVDANGAVIVDLTPSP